MLRLSLSARLTLTFAAITAACFAAVGFLLYRAAAQRIYAQDETNLVLTARHLRRLAAELDSVQDVVAHQDRLVIGVLGDTNNALRITDDAGRLLVEHNPSHYAIAAQPPVPADRRIVAEAIHRWQGNGGQDAQVHGITAIAPLRDGSRVSLTVARSLADREALLAHYLRDMLHRLLAGLLAAVVLSYLLVRRALRPLRTMATDAAAIHAQRLDTRLSVGKAPPELQALATALNDMLGRLEEGFSRVWRFTVDLAHDLRTPIGNLRGSNEVALTRPRSQAEYEALLGSNIEECDRVSRTIESVLFLARAESPQFALQRTELDVRAELERIADYFEGIAADAGVAIDVRAAAPLRADRDLFRRAVSNLLSNALRYTPRGMTIRLVAEKTGRGTQVSVENPGQPIPAEHLDKLFDRFYRVDRSRSDSANSTGLGLSIVHSIMELHGGRASVESGPTATRFTLWFPDAPTA
jgi:two-component system heavy metal sensor histidine kinase CusS